jgi:hypothetical protein
MRYRTPQNKLFPFTKWLLHRFNLDLLSLSLALYGTNGIKIKKKGLQFQDYSENLQGFFLSSESERALDGVALQRLLHQLCLLLHVH